MVHARETRADRKDWTARMRQVDVLDGGWLVPGRPPANKIGVAVWSSTGTSTRGNQRNETRLKRASEQLERAQDSL